jgi:Domain of unknown function (DUF1993)
LDKAEAHAGNRKIDPEVLLNYRLAPDMLPFVRQIQIAADLAKGAAARLAGVEVPKHDDTEKTFADLKARIANTVAFVESIQPNDIDGHQLRPSAPVFAPRGLCLSEPSGFESISIRFVAVCRRKPMAGRHVSRGKS